MTETDLTKGQASDAKTGKGAKAKHKLMKEQKESAKPAALEGTVEWALTDGGWAETRGTAWPYVRVDFQDGETGLWSEADEQRKQYAPWTLRYARSVIAQAIAKGQTGRTVRYRLVEAQAPTTMGEETKRKLREASARKKLAGRQAGKAAVGTASSNQGGTNMNSADTAAPAGKKGKKAKKQEPEAKAYQVVTYIATAKVETEKGKALLDKGGYASLILKATTKHVSFDQLLDAIKPGLKGKPVETIGRNTRWYINDLMKKGFLKSSTEKVEATSAEEARAEA